MIETTNGTQERQLGLGQDLRSRKREYVKKSCNTNPVFNAGSQDLTNVQKAAVELLRLGFSVIPTNTDKTPACQWKLFQKTRMEPAEVKKYFHPDSRLAIIGGAVSGNLEAIDIDDQKLFKPFLEALEDHLPGLPAKLCQRKTPKGYHLIFRSKEPVVGNQKLAVSADRKVRIETRGEGGYFLHSPSVGYEVIKNSLKDCPVLSADEVRAIHLVAGMFDERSNQEEQSRKKQTGDGIRPGDAFNQGHSAGDLLQNYGWKPARKTTAGMGYTRPGKKAGVSGVLLDNGNFYVWSTNAHPLEAGQSYSPFSLYTMYEHGGDYQAAARDLANKGYGSAGTEQQGQDKWPDPLPIKSELPPVEPLIEKMIPEPFRAWVLDAANRMQVSSDYIIASLLVVCGSIVGTSCRIRPKQRDDWTCTSNLWGGAVGPPSILKTPALNESVNKTLGRLEAAAREKHEQAVNEYEASAMVGAAKVKAIKGAIEKAAKLERDGKNTGKSLDKLAGELQELQSCELPTERRYKTNDASIEKIVELLEQNPNGLLYFRDELIGLFKRMERNGNEQDRAFLLESWNGDGSHTDDRIGRGTVRTDNLCISLLGGIQPDRIAGYLRRAINDGDNDGFVQRLQLLVYPDPVANWQYQDKYPDTEAKNRAYAVVERLAARGEGEKMNERYLRFSKEGQEVFKQWYTQLFTEKLHNQNEHPVMLEHLAKYGSLMPSLALIFHLVEAADKEEEPGPVSEEAATMAAAWCEYLESHARRIYSLALDTGQAGGARLAEKIKAGRLGQEFKLRDVQMKKWGMLTKKHLVQEAIDYLVERKWLRENLSPAGGNQGGRPAATTYQVNPKIFSECTE